MVKKKSPRIPKSLTTVTPFSKMLALLLFILFVLVGVYVGMQYQKVLDVLASNSATLSATPTPR